MNRGHSTTIPFCDDSGARSQAVVTKLKGKSQRRRFGGTSWHFLLAAVSQVLLGDRKGVGPSRQNFDVPYDADPAFLVRELHVVPSRKNILECQPLISVDSTIGIVLALIGSPLCSSGRCEVEFLYCGTCEIPELQALSRSRSNAQYEQRENYSNQRLHIALTPKMNNFDLSGVRCDAVTHALWKRGGEL